MTEQWKILKSELIFEAQPWLKLSKETVQLPDGKIISDFYQIEQRDCVEVVASNRDKKILGLWHYKHGVKREHLGLPAGYIDQGELAFDAAKRELAEECQLQSNDWKELGVFNLEGNRGPAKGYLYLAENCEISPVKLPSDDLEISRFEWLSMHEWLEHVRNGNVAVMSAALAILLASQILIPFTSALCAGGEDEGGEGVK
ncbi:MAG: NUDIX hydrolase [Gammaproteobacteria bacterium]|nr:NUDIX hydrolase [Gammaproteobacteria bacterium]